MTQHPAITAGRTAVVTGAASGIGLAMSRRLAGLGMNVCMADLEGSALDRAAASVSEAAADGARVRAVPTDVSRLDDVRRLKEAAYDSFGEVALLMNNAAVDEGGGPLEHLERWRRLLEINLWGVIHGVQTFAPAMIA